MSDEDKKPVPPAGQTEDKDKKVPPTPESGKTEDKKQEAPEQVIPENLKGKSTDELVKMYGELEKKLGQHSDEVSQAREYQKQMQIVLNAVYADPDLTEKVKGAIAKSMGQEPDKPKVDENRVVLEGQILREFEREVGLEYLTPEQKKDVYSKVSDYLLDIADPSGQKSSQEALTSISLTKLPKLLRHAYYLANRDGDIKKATDEALAKAKQVQAAAIGSIPSSGSVSENVTLTPEQREVARKLGISEENYLKRLKEQKEEKKE